MTNLVTNQDYIEAILELPNNELSKTKLGKMKKEDLELHLYKLQAELEESKEEVKADEPEASEELETVSEAPTVEDGAQEQEQATEEPKEEPKVEVVDGDEVIFETDIKLGIHTPYLYNTKHKGSRVAVTNLGRGDVYVDKDNVKHGDKSKRLLQGETNIFEDVSLLVLIASSQPQVKIQEL